MNEYIIKDERITVLRISGNKHNGDILIDTNDINLINKISWYIKDGSKHYVVGKFNNKTVKLHRYLMNVKDSKDIVDHIDGDTFNNTRSNLRVVNSSINNINIRNLRKTNKSGVSGVYFKEKQITIDSKGNTHNHSAKWCTSISYKGLKKTKSFSIDKYGSDKAKDMAIQWRKSELEKRGI